MARITIDTDILRQNDLSVNEYLELLYYYSLEKVINEDFIAKYSPAPPVTLHRLATLNFIFLENGGRKVVLRERTRDLFEGSTDLFLKWFNIYPIKTPSGRVLRPGSDETVRGRKLRKKWNKYFKNKADLANKAIKILEAELAWRRQTNSFDFMQMAETWLNQGSWEVYEHLLDEFSTNQSKEQEDMI